MTEDGLGLVLLQRGSFFDNRFSITQSAVFENQPSVLQILWITASSIGPKLMKPPSISSRTQARLKLIVASATIRIITVYYNNYGKHDGITQNFLWIKVSLKAHTLYWHKNFAEFNLNHRASCSPGSSGWSSRTNTPRPGPNIECTSIVFSLARTVRTIPRHDRSIAS